MVVKSVRGRRRYVAFKVDAELTRETSGTLRTLRDKYEVLKRTKVPARK